MSGESRPLGLDNLAQYEAKVNTGRSPEKLTETERADAERIYLLQEATTRIEAELSCRRPKSQQEYERIIEKEVVPLLDRWRDLAKDLAGLDSTTYMRFVRKQSGLEG